MGKKQTYVPVGRVERAIAVDVAAVLEAEGPVSNGSAERRSDPSYMKGKKLLYSVDARPISPTSSE